MEVGHVGQNISLQVTSLNLGTVVVGAFDDDKVHQIINMANDEVPLYIMPVGRPRQKSTYAYGKDEAIDSCLAQPKADGTACDNGLYCNIGETCQVGVCTGGSARNCDDGEPCTTDSCDKVLDSCVNTWPYWIIVT